jgi:hypothetical protein
MLMASAWKLDSTIPEAIIPAAKYCVKETPGAMSALNTDPKMNSRMTGNAKVKTMASRSRTNMRSSIPVRASPSRSVLFARGAAGGGERGHDWVPSSAGVSIIDR